MCQWNQEKKKNFSIVAACVMVASAVTICAVVCAKSVSVLFKLSKALDIYIKEHKLSLEQNQRLEHLYHECEDEEEISF